MAFRSEKLFDAALPAGFDGKFYWDFLDEAWRREGAYVQITPMDMDGLVHVRRRGMPKCEGHGRFISFETKHPGTTIPNGQLELLTDLMMALAPEQMIIIMCAKRPEDVREWRAMRKNASGKMEEKHYIGNANNLLTYCRKIFLHFDK